MAREASHLYGLLALLDPLLCRAPLVVKSHYHPARGFQVGHDEPDSREQLPGMKLHFRHHTPRRLPARGLVEEALVPLPVQQTRRVNGMCKVIEARFNSLPSAGIGVASALRTALSSIRKCALLGARRYAFRSLCINKLRQLTYILQEFSVDLLFRDIDAEGSLDLKDHIHYARRIQTAVIE